jgi:hypothetical protein
MFLGFVTIALVHANRISIICAGDSKATSVGRFFTINDLFDSL